jgi:hypothetical protein
MTLAMSAEGDVLVLKCAECGAAWLPTDEARWSAYLGGDDLDESGEVIWYCPGCAEREFAF